VRHTDIQFITVITVILLRAPCQNVDVLLSNITFIIFLLFSMCETIQLPLGFSITFAVFHIAKQFYRLWKWSDNMQSVPIPIKKTGHVIEQVIIRLAVGHYQHMGDPLQQSFYLQHLSRLLVSKSIGVTTLTFLGHVTSSITWPFDSQVAISYGCFIVIKSLSPAVSEILGPENIGVTTLTFQGHVTIWFQGTKFL